MELGLSVGAGVRTVVLVEGVSDQAAVEALARRLGRDLAADGVAVVAMGGATNIGHALRQFAPDGPLEEDVELAGLCDIGEVGAFRHALERAGFGSDLTTEALEDLGFFVCDRDLEDELIRALGPAAVEDVIEAAGELRPFRTFLGQPDRQGIPIERQLRRFLGTRSGRKERYGRLLVDALDLGHVPRPLARLLDHV